MTLISFNKNHLLFNIENSNQLLRLSYSHRFTGLLDDQIVSKQKSPAYKVYLSLFVLQNFALQRKPNTNFFQKRKLYGISDTEGIRLSRIESFEQNAICSAKLNAPLPQSILLLPPFFIDPVFSNAFTTKLCKDKKSEITTWIKRPTLLSSKSKEKDILRLYKTERCKQRKNLSFIQSKSSAYVPNPQLQVQSFLQIVDLYLQKDLMPLKGKEGQRFLQTEKPFLLGLSSICKRGYQSSICKRAYKSTLVPKKKKKIKAKYRGQNKIQKSLDSRLPLLISYNFNHLREKLDSIKQLTPKLRIWSFAFGSSFFLLAITSILQRQEQNCWFFTFSRNVLPGFYLTCEESSWECFENITLKYLSRRCLPYHNKNTRKLVKKIDCYKDILYLGLSELWSQQAIQNYTAVFSKCYNPTLSQSSLISNNEEERHVKESKKKQIGLKTQAIPFFTEGGLERKSFDLKKDPKSSLLPDSSPLRESSYRYFFNKNFSLKKEWIVEPWYQLNARVPPKKDITKIVTNFNRNSFSWRQTLWPFQPTKAKLSSNKNNIFKLSINRYKEQVSIENDSIPSKMSSSVVSNYKQNTQHEPSIYKAPHVTYPFIQKKISDGAGVTNFLLREKAFCDERTDALARKDIKLYNRIEKRKSKDNNYVDSPNDIIKHLFYKYDNCCVEPKALSLTSKNPTFSSIKNFSFKDIFQRSALATPLQSLSLLKKENVDTLLQESANTSIQSKAFENVISQDRFSFLQKESFLKLPSLSSRDRFSLKVAPFFCKVSFDYPQAIAKGNVLIYDENTPIDIKLEQKDHRLKSRSVWPGCRINDERPVNSSTHFKESQLKMGEKLSGYHLCKRKTVSHRFMSGYQHPETKKLTLKGGKDKLISRGNTETEFSITIPPALPFYDSLLKDLKEVLSNGLQSFVPSVKGDQTGDLYLLAEQNTFPFPSGGGDKPSLLEKDQKDHLRALCPLPLDARARAPSGQGHQVQSEALQEDLYGQRGIKSSYNYKSPICKKLCTCKGASNKRLVKAQTNLQFVIDLDAHVREPGSFRVFDACPYKYFCKAKQAHTPLMPVPLRGIKCKAKLCKKILCPEGAKGKGATNPRLIWKSPGFSNQGTNFPLRVTKQSFVTPAFSNQTDKKDKLVSRVTFLTALKKFPYRELSLNEKGEVEPLFEQVNKTFYLSPYRFACKKSLFSDYNDYLSWPKDNPVAISINPFVEASIDEEKNGVKDSWISSSSEPKIKAGFEYASTSSSKGSDTPLTQSYNRDSNSGKEGDHSFASSVPDNEDIEQYDSKKTAGSESSPFKSSIDAKDSIPIESSNVGEEEEKKKEITKSEWLFQIRESEQSLEKRKELQKLAYPKKKALVNTCLPRLPGKIESLLVSDRKASFFGITNLFPKRLISEDQKQITRQILQDDIYRKSVSLLESLHQSLDPLLAQKSLLFLGEPSNQKRPEASNIGASSEKQMQDQLQKGLKALENRSASKTSYKSSICTCKPLSLKKTRAQVITRQHPIYTPNKRLRLRVPQPSMASQNSNNQARLDDLNLSSDHRWWQKRRISSSLLGAPSKRYVVMPEISSQDWRKIIEWQLKIYFLEEEKRLLQLQKGAKESVPSEKRSLSSQAPDTKQLFTIKKLAIFLPWASLKKSLKKPFEWPVTLLSYSSFLRSERSRLFGRYNQTFSLEENKKRRTPKMCVCSERSTFSKKLNTPFCISLREEQKNKIIGKVLRKDRAKLFQKDFCSHTDYAPFSTFCVAKPICSVAKSNVCGPSVESKALFTKQGKHSLQNFIRNKKTDSCFVSPISFSPSVKLPFKTASLLAKDKAKLANTESDKESSHTFHSGLAKNKLDQNTISKPFLFEAQTQNSYLFLHSLFLVIAIKRLFDGLYKIFGTLILSKIKNSSLSVLLLPLFFNAFGSSNSPYSFDSLKTRAKHLVGSEDTISSLSEIVWYLRNSCRGRLVPRGVVLVDKASSESTNFLKAIGGEAQVPVIVQSLRALPYTQNHPQRQLEKILTFAQKRAPCILFLDDIDSIGQSRTLLLKNNEEPYVRNPGGGSALSEISRYAFKSWRQRVQQSRNYWSRNFPSLSEDFITNLPQSKLIKGPTLFGYSHQDQTSFFGKKNSGCISSIYKNSQEKIKWKKHISNFEKPFNSITKIIEPSNLGSANSNKASLKSSYSHNRRFDKGKVIADSGRSRLPVQSLYKHKAPLCKKICIPNVPNPRRGSGLCSICNRGYKSSICKRTQEDLYARVAMYSEKSSYKPQRSRPKYDGILENFSELEKAKMTSLDAPPETEKVVEQRRVDLMLRLLTVMDGISGLNGVLLVTTSKNPSRLDPALLRPGRFEKLIHLKLPNKKKRISLLKRESARLGHTNPMPWEYFGRQTQDMTGSDIASAVNHSAFRAILQSTVHTFPTLEHGIRRVARSGEAPLYKSISTKNKFLVPNPEKAAMNTSSSRLSTLSCDNKQEQTRGFVKASHPLHLQFKKVQTQKEISSQTALYRAGKGVVRAFILNSSGSSFYKVSSNLETTSKEKNIASYKSTICKECKGKLPRKKKTFASVKGGMNKALPCSRSFAAMQSIDRSQKRFLIKKDFAKETIRLYAGQAALALYLDSIYSFKSKAFSNTFLGAQKRLIALQSTFSSKEAFGASSLIKDLAANFCFYPKTKEKLFKTNGNRKFDAPLQIYDSMPLYKSTICTGKGARSFASRFVCKSFQDRNSFLDIDFLYYNMVLTCFYVAFQNCTENRELLDFVTDHLMRFKVLKLHEMFRIVLFYS